MLFGFRKIQKSLNPFNNCRSFVLIFLICFFIGTWWSGNIVYLPCTNKVFQFTPLQVSTKGIVGGTVFDACGIKDVVSEGGFKSQHSQFVLESGNKVFGGLVKIISPGNVFAEEVSGKATDEHSCDSIQKASKGTFHIDFTSFEFFKGWLMGICFGLLGMYLFSRYY